jgi:hypothetical protein
MWVAEENRPFPLTSIRRAIVIQAGAGLVERVSEFRAGPPKWLDQSRPDRILSRLFFPWKTIELRHRFEKAKKRRRDLYRRK